MFKNRIIDKKFGLKHNVRHWRANVKRKKKKSRLPVANQATFVRNGSFGRLL